MNKLLLLLITIYFIAPIQAHTSDSTRAMQVGDSIFISACPKGGYKFMQYFKKTRFPSPNATYNKETGDDFYEYFFLDGDFDAKILPCEYGNKKYKILSIRILADKATGADRPVMFVDIGLNTVAWIEVGAVAAVEIYVE
jgi:hypothetical protein